MFAIGVPGPMEMVIVGMIALLLFSSRVPGALRSVGQSISEFRKGMKDDEAPDRGDSAAR